jgi:uncharacterized Zn-finger protein
MANGRPMTSPKVPIMPGHRMPSSNDRIVPDTAPTANSTPSVLPQRRASSRQAGSPVRRPRHSATSTSSGNPTPRQATMMCQPRDTAIWVRAAIRSAAPAAVVTTCV